MHLTGEVYAGIQAAMGVAGVSATYVRGEDSVDVTVLPGSRGQSRGGRDTAPIQLADESFILQLSELGELGLPTEGDQLTVDQGGRLIVLSLQQIPTGERAWDYLYGKEFARLHMTYFSDDVGDEVDHDANPALPSTIVRGLKWQRQITVTNLTAMTLSNVTLASGDLLEIVIDHDGTQRTLTYHSGIDFEFTAPSTISLTQLPVALGDILIVKNLGTPRQ